MSGETVNRSARPLVRSMNAYHVEAIPVPIVLDANEAPYPPPPALQEKLAVLMAGTLLHRYPDMEADFLRTQGAKKEGIDKSEILFGNGSDDVLQVILGAYLDPGEKVLVPTPTFSMYKQGALIYSGQMVETPLGEEFAYDGEALIEAVKKEQPKIVFLARPNNPTGGILAKEWLPKLLDAAPGMVVIDEAYIDYCAEGSVGPIFREHENAIVVRTLSKVGFAALRLGYMMAAAAVIEELNKVRQPFNVNGLTQACGAEVFKNWDMLTPMFTEVKAERQNLFDDLTALDGVTPYRSEANFVLFRVEGDPGKLFEALIGKGVRVRWFKGAPRLDDCFRVTVGSPMENGAFIDALAQALAS